MSADAVQRLLAKYQRIAGHSCPSLKTKRVTPHVLRHTLAMTLLQAGIDRPDPRLISRFSGQNAAGSMFLVAIEI